MALQTLEPVRTTFIHSPKTAGTSISSWLRNNFEVVDTKRQHDRLKTALPVLGEFGWSYSVVRNPWAHTYSWYTFKLRRTIESLENPKEQHDIEQLTKNKQELDKGFKYYVMNTPPRRQDIWLYGIDYRIRHENLAKEFEVVQDKLNCYEPLEHLNKSAEKLEYLDNYDSETRDRVWAINKALINKFGYEFET